MLGLRYAPDGSGPTVGGPIRSAEWCWRPCRSSSAGCGATAGSSGIHGNVHRPDAAPARDRTLTDNEIVAFWHACDDLGEPIGPRLKLLLLTGCRRTELAGMLWSEIGTTS
jgi:integrase